MPSDSFRRPPMNKEATPKNIKGLIQKTSDEKRGKLKETQRSSFKRPPMKKESTLKKCKGARSEDLR
jgi:hypothetical protein